MFLSSWITFALLGGIASNAFNFFSRYVLKDKDDPIVYAWFYETLRFFDKPVKAQSDIIELQ